MTTRSDNLFERVKANHDLRQYMVLEGQTTHGRYNSGVCPFHEDNSPSCMVFQDGWNCMASSCKKKSGTIIDWMAFKKFGTLTPTKQQILQVARELDKGEPVKERTYLRNKRVRVKKRKRRELKVAKPGNEISYEAWQSYYNLRCPESYEYLSNRGFNRYVADWYGFGWTGTSIVIPVWDGEPKYSKVAGLRFRNLYGEPRYYGLKDLNPPMMFNSWVYRLALKYGVEKMPKLFVFLGEFDALLATVTGIPAVSPTNGSRAFHKEWLEGFQGTVVFVSDIGEEDDALKSAAEFGIKGEVLHLPIGKDFGKDYTEQVLKLEEGLAKAVSIRDKAIEKNMSESAIRQHHKSVNTHRVAVKKFINHFIRFGDTDNSFIHVKEYRRLLYTWGYSQVTLPGYGERMNFGNPIGFLEHEQDFYESQGPSASWLVWAGVIPDKKKGKL